MDSDSEKGGKISRRDFLKIGAVSAAALVLRGESVTQSETSLISINLRRQENPYRTATYALEKIDEVLKEEGPVSLVVLPEYTFRIYDKDDNPRAIVLRSPKRWYEDPFEVDRSKTDPFVLLIVDNLKTIASTHKTHIFAATFIEKTNTDKKDFNTLLHIDDKGAIVGIKRKFFPPQGSFEITTAGKNLKVLPLICGEVWKERTPIDAEGRFKSIPPDWVKEGAPYDVMTHSIAQGDVDFEVLDSLSQGNKPEGKISKERFKWLKEAFADYYQEYMQFLKPNAAIVVSDWGMSSIFRKDKAKIEKYKETKNYDIARI